MKDLNSNGLNEHKVVDFHLYASFISAFFTWQPAGATEVSTGHVTKKMSRNTGNPGPFGGKWRRYCAGKMFYATVSNDIFRSLNNL